MVLKITKMAEFKIKRVYDSAAQSDGMRVLIDRIWPRGLTKEKAGIDYWAKELAPSSSLRKWYQHDPDKWEEFKRRYSDELKNNQTAVDGFLNMLESSPVTLLFGARETKLNNAHVLKAFLIASQDQGGKPDQGN